MRVTLLQSEDLGDESKVELCPAYLMYPNQVLVSTRLHYIG